MSPVRPSELHLEFIVGTALAHFFLGLMKADGAITPAEERRMSELAAHYQEELPCKLNTVLERIAYLRVDIICKDWTPQQHLLEGLKLLDEYRHHRGFLRRYITNLMELLEAVMLEDGIDEAERAYLMQLEAELTPRFLALVD